MSKVYVMQNRTGKEKWYKGVVIGIQTFTKESMAFMGEPKKEYREDKLLVKMSNGKKITVWRSQTYNEVKP